MGNKPKEEIRRGDAAKGVWSACKIPAGAIANPAGNSTRARANRARMRTRARANRVRNPLKGVGGLSWFG